MRLIVTGWNDMYPESWTHIYELDGLHGCYPVFYRRHPFCFCLNSFIIVVIYIFFNRFWEFFKRWIVFLITIIHFIFESCKKCLHNTIIIAVAFSGHGLDNAVLLQSVSIVGMLVLPTLIRVKYKSFNRRKFIKSPI